LNEQAIWGIGNIAGDCVKFRDLILTKGGLNLLIKVCENSSNKNVIRQSAWAMSNLCRGSPAPKYELIKLGISTIAKIILTGFLETD
jgi:hypothetical protein